MELGNGEMPAWVHEVVFHGVTYTVIITQFEPQFVNCTCTGLCVCCSGRRVP